MLICRSVETSIFMRNLRASSILLSQQKHANLHLEGTIKKERNSKIAQTNHFKL